METMVKTDRGAAWPPIPAVHSGSAQPVLDYARLVRSLKEFIANQSHYLREGAAQQKEIRDRLIKSSFAHHYANNRFYQALCQEKGLDPAAIFAGEVEQIPVIPIHLFKDQKFAHLLLSKGLGEIEFELRSTGTSGVPSVSRRDPDTVDALTIALGALYRDYFGICNGCGLFLCPSPAEMPEMGMVKALNFLSGMLDDRVYLVERYRFSSKDALALLEGWQDRAVRHIIGPPFMINRLLRYMDARDIRLPLDRKSKVIMLGGWKRFGGEQISRERLHDLCHERLGLEAHQIRDMYGLVECNMLAIECERGHKHVPPWVRIVIRRLGKAEEVLSEPHQNGIVSVLDPTGMSYPCFIQTEDVGIVTNDGPCACGRTSQTLKFIRRIDGAELGCCAINLERYMHDDEIVRECKL